MAQLSKHDKKVVRRWWKDAKRFIYDNGFTLKNYNPSLTPSTLSGKYKSFQEILGDPENTISARAKSNRDGFLVELRVSRTGRDIEGVQATYIQVDNGLSYTVAIIPIAPQRRGWLVRFFPAGSGP